MKMEILPHPDNCSGCNMRPRAEKSKYCEKCKPFKNKKQAVSEWRIALRVVAILICLAIFVTGLVTIIRSLLGV